jgi:GNAT superfamily N-acetyltransferase
MDLTFRETQAGDIEDMFSVRARTRENPISKEQLATYGITSASSAANMASGRMKGWGCFHHSVLVGFCNGDITTGEVLVLAVLPEYEGNGIGTRLLLHVVEWLRTSGSQQPWLAASPDPRIRAHGFYRALGWQPNGRSLENGDEILELKSNNTPQPIEEMQGLCF